MVGCRSGYKDARGQCVMDKLPGMLKEVTGTDYGFLLLTFPLWTASTYDAIQDAKEFSGADPDCPNGNLQK